MGFNDIFKSSFLENVSSVSLLDMGIALAHLYVSNEASFRYFACEGVTEPDGYSYIGSFTL